MRLELKRQLNVSGLSDHSVRTFNLYDDGE